jgi:hypothetical protein
MVRFFYASYDPDEPLEPEVPAKYSSAIKREANESEKRE